MGVGLGTGLVVCNRTPRPPAVHTPATPPTAGNPISVTARAGQKVVGHLVQPWNLPLFKPGRSKKLTRRCRVHLKLEYTPFAKEGEPRRMAHALLGV